MLFKSNDLNVLIVNILPPIPSNKTLDQNKVSGRYTRFTQISPAF